MYIYRANGHYPSSRLCTLHHIHIPRVESRFFDMAFITSTFQQTPSSSLPFVPRAVAVDRVFSFTTGRERSNFFSSKEIGPNPNCQVISPGSKILRFPSNFVRQLSNKARRNCSNIGVAQVVAASWSDGNRESSFSASAYGDSALSAVPEVEAIPSVLKDGDGVASGESTTDESGVLQSLGLIEDSRPPFPIFRFDGSLTVHAGTCDSFFFTFHFKFVKT